jgi:hypothetical protein
VSPSAGPVVERLVGVYHAEGSLRGELAYGIGKLLGRAHCALCDITHGVVRRRPAIDEWVAGLPVPMTFVHLDERDATVRAASEGRTPCVLALTGAGARLLLGPDELEACAGRPDRLAAAVERRADDLGLRWPAQDRPASGSA